jgi:hypothetical protein
LIDNQTCPLHSNNFTISNNFTPTVNNNQFSINFDKLYENSNECLWQATSIELPTTIATYLLSSIALSPSGLIVSFISHYMKCMIVKGLDQVEFLEDYPVINGAIGGATKYAFREYFEAEPNYALSISKGAYNGAMYAHGKLKPYFIEAGETIFSIGSSDFIKKLKINTIAGLAATTSENDIYSNRETILGSIFNFFSLDKKTVLAENESNASSEVFLEGNLSPITQLSTGEELIF